MINNAVRETTDLFSSSEGITHLRLDVLTVCRYVAVRREMALSCMTHFLNGFFGIVHLWVSHTMFTISCKDR